MVRTGQAKFLPKLQVSNYIVAYLDVLGAESFMKGDLAEKFLNDLNSIYYDSISHVLMSGLNNNGSDNNISCIKIFSDNILLAIKLEDNDKHEKNKLSNILNCIANIYIYALRAGYLLRGGITKGEFCCNNTFVYGKALINAVSMEENIAIYPRIVVQEEIQNVLPGYFKKAGDGIYYLNCFEYAKTFDDYIFKTQLLNMLKSNTRKEVLQKINWVISYYNEFFSNKFISKDMLITEQEINENIIALGGNVNE